MGVNISFALGLGCSVKNIPNEKEKQTVIKNNIKNKLNSYIFILNTDTINDLTKSLENEGAIIANVQSMINLTDEEYKDGYDYEQMMDTFIETIKTEVYN